MTPDQALVMMDRKLKKFENHIRPICLATVDVRERPTCPDNSRDKTIMKKQGPTATRKSEMKIPGGCVTVAGWGHRWDQRKLMSSCTTDHSPLGPDKVA